MRRAAHTVFIFSAYWGAILCSIAAADWDEVLPERETAGSWYSPAPLLESIRPSVRGDLPGHLEGALDVLTLYDLHLSVQPQLRSFSLDERIFWTNQTDGHLSEVVLRVYSNAVPGSPPTRLDRIHCRHMICETTITSPTAIVVRPIIPIPPGGRLKIRVQFTGTLREIDSSRTTMLAQGLEGMSSLGSGEHAGDYGLLAIGDGITSLANFYAVLARRANGDWVRREATTMGDLGPDVMSHVRAKVVLPQGAQLASTGIVLDQVNANRTTTHHIVAGLVRDFSVLSCGQFHTAQERLGDVVVRSHSLPADRRSGEKVLDVAAKSLEIFQDRFGPYPYRDLDVVEAALVGGAGGVEFAGLVTVASMLYRPTGLGERGSGPLDALQSRMLEFVTAHEVAHQYWHGLVGSDSRRHPFVDESLAQYSAMLYLQDRYGTDRMVRDSNQQVRGNYHTMRAMRIADGAVHRPVDAFRSPIEYAGLVYGKGPYMYPALRQALGDDAFFRGVQAYVENYRFRSAPGRGLVETLARGAQASRVNRIARRWLVERHGDEDLGMPDLTAMMEEAMGGAAGDPQMQEIMRMVEELGPGGNLGRATPDEDSLNDLRNLLGGQSGTLEALEGLLGETAEP